MLPVSFVTIVLGVLVTAHDGVAVGTSVHGRVAAVARGELVALP